MDGFSVALESVPGIARALLRYMMASKGFCPYGALDLEAAVAHTGFEAEYLWIAIGHLEQAGLLVVDQVHPTRPKLGVVHRGQWK